MNQCQRCDSSRILRVSAKCSDMCSITSDDELHDGYAPSDLGIGEGDYIAFKWCLECGQIQDEFPKEGTLNESD